MAIKQHDLISNIRTHSNANKTISKENDFKVVILQLIKMKKYEEDLRTPGQHYLGRLPNIDTYNNQVVPLKKDHEF